MKDYFGTPLAIGDVVVGQFKNSQGLINDTFRGVIVSAKEQKNGTKIQLKRLDFPSSSYFKTVDEYCNKFSHTVFKYPNVSEHLNLEVE